ncbi:MAG: class I SAM-dependent methyltransferase [Methylococcaceae bacterium]|nr:class I SAM-dependent methyltransferase [Methylococcaceae bacterium]
MNKFFPAFLLVLSSFATQAADDFDRLRHVLDGKQRSAEHKARDKYRHPQQTLEFFDVRDNMTVVEIWPGEGWYTEIMAPYLRKHGKLYAAHFSRQADNDYFKSSRAHFENKLKKSPKIYDKVKLTVLQPPEHVLIAPDGSADRVLTFRNVHNWMKNDQAPVVFKAMFNALKPGGILGIVEHRNSTAKPQDPKAMSGYVTEDYLIALARNTGFEFLAKSEVNANSKDTKDYPDGVWTLPPTLRLNEKDRKKYLKIGESDRMTIKFIKPK